ncbi:hypothetical protein BJ742DRAFT_711417, partial [Cladochytrium replicatum]
MKAFNKLFNPKDKTAKTAKKEPAIVTVQSLSPLNNDTVLVQLELPPDVTFSDFAAAALSKLDLAGHRFNGHSPQFLINTAGGKMSILDNRDVVNAIMSKSQVFVEWRVREIANSSLPLPVPVPLAAAKWICKEHRTASHDIFVSYRRENEGDLVKTLVPYLEKVGKRRLGNKMSVFWDQKCLNDAQNWKEGFINGLQQSRVIVYLLSAESFTTMNQNVLAGKEDNVLIEIEKGIELAEYSPNVRLCPVLLDTIDGDGNVVPFTKLPKFDPVLKSFSNDQLVSVFSPEAFVTSQSRSGKTLCDTISWLFQNNCIHLTPTEGRLYQVVYNVIDLVRPLSEVTSDILSTLPEPPVHFVGRSNILSEVQMQLINHGAAILVAQGGMGKSSIALQYVRQHRRFYDSIFWIPCNTAATAISALRGYAGSHFHLTTFETIAPEDLVRFMMLDQVLDSVILSGDVLVTSRSNSSLEVKMRSWVDPLVKNIPVETWSSDISHQFLMQRLSKRYQYLISSQNEVAALHELLQHIDGLPLAAEQAAAFIERQQCGFSDLIVRINSYLPQAPDSRVGIASLSLSAIVKAGLDTIGPAASLLMQVLSFYGSRDIPFDLVNQVVFLLSECNFEGTSKSDFDSLLLLRQLRSQSLVYNSANNTLTTHSLIQEVVMSETLLSTRPQLTQISLQSLLTLFPPKIDDQFESSKIPLATVLLSHTEAAAKKILPDSVDNPSESFGTLDDLQCQCQSFCLFVGYDTQCMDILNDMYSRRVAHYNTLEHIHIASALNSMGVVSFWQGKYAKAANFLKDSHGIKMKLYGTSEHPEVAETLCNMGQVADRQGDYAKAMQLYEESLAIYVKVYGTREHAEVAVTLSCMGQVAHSQGDYAKAMQLYEESLAIKVKVYGTREHAEVALTLNCMGQVADRQGDYAKAMQLYDEELAIVVKVYGAREHAEVAVALNSMGQVAHRQGDYAKAMQLNEESLAIKVKVYGTREHASVATTLNCMGQVAHSQGDYAKAMQLYEENLAIYVKVYGTREHAEVAVTLSCMGQVADRQGDYVKAMELYEESLAIKHGEVAVTLNSIGQVAHRQGDYAKAMQLYEESLAIEVKVYGTREHAEVAVTLSCMGQVADSQGDYAKAMQLYEESLAIEVKVYGTREHASVAVTLNCMGQVADRQGDYSKAMQLYEESLAIKVKVYGTREHAEVAVTLNGMGQVAHRQGDYAKAMQLYEESLAIDVKVYGTREHPSVAIILHSMSMCYYKMVDMSGMQRCADEALQIYSQCLLPDHPHVAALLEFLSDVSR